MAKAHRTEWKPIATSEAADRTINPIRAIVDHIQPNKALALKPIPLSIGDPTLDGNLIPPQCYTDAVATAIRQNTAKTNGYGPSTGQPEAREAVAEYLNKNFRGANPSPLTAGDIVLGSGASHTLEMCMCALMNPGDEILIPAPCFSLYDVITSNRGFVSKHYSLNPAASWACDLAQMESLVTPKTKAILITNPSNPCGSNFEEAHVKAIVALAEKLQLPIISDEIYAGLTFDIHEKEGKPQPKFTSVAEVATTVPCLIVGGIAKTFLVPGHRLGWVAKHDPSNVLGAVWGGVAKLSTLIVGPNAVVQAALPTLLKDTPQSYKDALRATLRDNARLCVDSLKGVEGISTVEPQGAMYLMVKIDFSAFSAASGIQDDKTFASKLVQARNVIVLPGSIFECPGFIRIVFTKPADQLKEALDRIVDFCRECREKK